jgi:hypothetical protein
MAKITEKELYQNLDFTCERCKAECQKINALESDVGYISQVDGTFVHLCQNCFNEIPLEQREERKVVETSFTIVIKADGEGAAIITDGNIIPYRRDATYLDIINACSQIARDVEEAILTQKLTNRIIGTLAMANKNASSKLIVPK